MSAFKAYDIRGVYGRDFTADTVYRVGRHLPALLNAKRFLIGHDARVSSPEVRDALARGLTESGANVDIMGLATTPMVYYFTAERGYDASVQITASHNPPDHNGMKISRAGALPVGRDTGLAELEARVNAGALPPVALQPGHITNVKLLDDFLYFLESWHQNLTGLRFAVDCSDGVAALIARRLFGPAPLYLNDTPDGRFPHHAPNPLEVENCEQLMHAVTREKLDFGVIFDGDGDRVMFVDETGGFVQPDYLIPILARHFLRDNPGATVLHDIRTSRGAIETLRADGAKPVMWKVGHAFAKIKLREINAICGGELAGHYYFRDFHCCDSGELAALIILGEIARAKSQGLTFSQLLAPIRCYATTGELNYRITRQDDALAAVHACALQLGGTPTSVADFDGIRLDFADWWVNVRKSNTEPYLRLILEAKTPALLASLRASLEATLKPFL